MPTEQSPTTNAQTRRSIKSEESLQWVSCYNYNIPGLGNAKKSSRYITWRWIFIGTHGYCCEHKTSFIASRGSLLLPRNNKLLSVCKSLWTQKNRKQRPIEVRTKMERSGSVKPCKVSLAEVAGNNSTHGKNGFAKRFRGFLALTRAVNNPNQLVGWLIFSFFGPAGTSYLIFWHLLQETRNICGFLTCFQFITCCRFYILNTTPNKVYYSLPIN